MAKILPITGLATLLGGSHFLECKNIWLFLVGLMMPPKNIFVYGTLLFDEVVHALTGENCLTIPAKLIGYRRCRIEDPHREAVGPVVVRKKGACTSGKVLLNLSCESFRAIELFEESAGGYEPVNSEVLCNDGRLLMVTFYRAQNDLSPMIRSENWSEQDFQNAALRLYVENRIPSLLKKWRELGLLLESNSNDGKLQDS